MYAAVCPTGGAATEAAAGTSFSFGGGIKERAGRIGGGGDEEDRGCAACGKLLRGEGLSGGDARTGVTVRGRVESAMISNKRWDWFEVD